MGHAHDSAARSQASLQAVFLGVFWAHVRLKANKHTHSRSAVRSVRTPAPLAEAGHHRPANLLGLLLESLGQVAQIPACFVKAVNRCCQTNSNSSPQGQ